MLMTSPTTEAPEPAIGPESTARLSKGDRRRDRILALLTSEPQENISVTDLSETFNVSVATIRRDLSHLQDQRLITRTYGGAALQHHPRAELTMVERVSTHVEAKRAIGQAAAALVEDGDLLILDSGSTTEQLAIALGDRPVSVITNGLRIVHQLVHCERIRVTVLGGSLRGFNETIYGADAEEMLRRVCATIAFIGTDAVDPVRGVTSRTYEQARLKSTMIQQADQVYFLADSSKLGEHPPFQYWSALPREWGIITDDGADPAALAELGQAGAAPIIVVPAATSPAAAEAD